MEKMKQTHYISNDDLFKARVKFYSFCVEPCTITWMDGHTEDHFDGYAKIVLESGEEVIWEYGGNAKPGQLLTDMMDYFDTFKVQIV